MSITDKQEAFCHKYIETGNASEAYRQAYNAQNMSIEAIWAEASKLKVNPTVALRLEELRSEHRERHKVTVDSITQELDDLVKEARSEKQFSPAITGVMGKAKIHGLIVDKGKTEGFMSVTITTGVPKPA